MRTMQRSDDHGSVYQRGEPGAVLDGAVALPDLRKCRRPADPDQSTAPAGVARTRCQNSIAASLEPADGSGVTYCSYSRFGDVRETRSRGCTRDGGVRHVHEEKA